LTKCQLIQNGTQNLKFEKGKENPMNILRKAAKIGSAAVILAGLLGIGSLSCAVCFAQSGGEAVYKAKCGMCHGADGLGATPTGKAMGVKAVSDPYITSLTEKQMFNSVKNGKERMPSFKNRLTDEQIRDAVAFYRELGGASSEPMPQAQDQGAQDQGDPMAAVAGEYVFEQSGIHYVFLPDGSCTTHGPGGVPTQCHFIVEGDWIRTTVTSCTWAGSLCQPWSLFGKGSRQRLTKQWQLRLPPLSPRRRPSIRLLRHHRLRHPQRLPFPWARRRLK
jgi:mono/diheme cytochrome c family protein